MFLDVDGILIRRDQILSVGNILVRYQRNVDERNVFVAFIVETFTSKHRVLRSELDCRDEETRLFKKFISSQALIEASVHLKNELTVIRDRFIKELTNE